MKSYSWFLVIKKIKFNSAVPYTFRVFDQEHLEIFVNVIQDRNCTKGISLEKSQM